MKIWEWAEPNKDMTPRYEQASDLEIICMYWGWWSREVFKKRPDNTFRIIPENCIEDFVTVNWAYEIGEII